MDTNKLLSPEYLKEKALIMKKSNKPIIRYIASVFEKSADNMSKLINQK